MGSVKIVALKNFAKFVGKHLSESLLNTSLQPATLLKDIVRHWYFPACEFFGGCFCSLHESLMRDEHSHESYGLKNPLEIAIKKV